MMPGSKFLLEEDTQLSRSCKEDARTTNREIPTTFQQFPAMISHAPFRADELTGMQKKTKIKDTKHMLPKKANAP